MDCRASLAMTGVGVTLAHSNAPKPQIIVKSEARSDAAIHQRSFLVFNSKEILMKEHFRQSMAWLHTWTGLLVGWVMFFVFVTGTAAFFNDEITRWMKPELPLRVEQQYPPTAEMAEKALAFLEKQREPAKGWVIGFPTDGSRIGMLGHKGGGLRGYQSFLKAWWGAGNIWLDPVSDEIIPCPETRDTEGGKFFFDAHYVLHYMDAQTGLYIVGVFTMMMFVALITGLIVHKRVFKDFFT
jgi:uncharacterized iron-regulated membrane protein